MIETKMSVHEVNDVKYRNHLLSKLASQQRDGVLCDVVLLIKDREFPAHKGVLAAASEYFLALFTTEMMEKNCTSVQLDLCPDIMQDLLNYIYTGMVTLNEFNVKDLIMAADYLIITDLKQMATEYLVSLLSVSNCVLMYDFAVHCNCVEIQLAAARMIRDNFAEVSNATEFLEMDYEFLTSLVSDDNIVVSREEEVYEAVLHWVKHDVEKRQAYFEKLFGKVRLFSMSKEYIRDHIEGETFVNNNVACMKLLIQGLNAFVFQDCEGPRSGNLKPRKCLEKEVSVIVATGGLTRGKSLKNVMAYYPEQNSWHQLADMSSDRNEHAVVVCGRFLYCIGGYPRGSSVDRFDPLTNTWSQVADLVQRTFAPAAVLCDEKIYVFGGKDGFQAINTVQCYQPDSDSWSLGPAMRHARKALCAVEFEGHVYAIGGCENDNYSLNTVEKLNVDTNEWTEASPMAEERKYACAAVLGDKIVVIGGFQGTSSSALGSCEIYSPRDDQWSTLANVNCPRAAGGVGRVGGKIYVFGGRHNSQAVDSVEWYDEENGKWIVDESVMPFGCTWFSCGVVTIRKDFVQER